MEKSKPQDFDIVEVGYGTNVWLGVFFEGSVWPNPREIGNHFASYFPYDQLHSAKIVGHYHKQEEDA